MKLRCSLATFFAAAWTAKVYNRIQTNFGWRAALFITTVWKQSMGLNVHGYKVILKQNHSPESPCYFSSRVKWAIQILAVLSKHGRRWEKSGEIYSGKSPELWTRDTPACLRELSRNISVIPETTNCGHNMLYHPKCLSEWQHTAYGTGKKCVVRVQATRYFWHAPFTNINKVFFAVVKSDGHVFQLYFNGILIVSLTSISNLTTESSNMHTLTVTEWRLVLPGLESPPPFWPRRSMFLI